MKKTLILFLIWLSANTVNAQSSSELNGKIVESLTLIDSVKNTDSDSKFESIFSANKQLAQNIAAYADALPGFTAQDLKDTACAVNSLYNSVSDDKKVRIVWWDDEGGGTVRNYDYIVFWDAGGKLNHKIFVSNIEDSDASKIYYTYIDSIVHLKRNDGSDLYFVTGGTLDRPANYNQHIFCYKIDATGTFTNDAPVFKAGNKMLSSIDVDCPSYFNDKESMHAFYTLMHFSSDKHMLYVPIFPDRDNEDEKEAEREDTEGKRKFHYFLYQFDGTNFVYKKKDL